MTGSDPFAAALADVNYGDFLAEALRYTYEPSRFKATAQRIQPHFPTKEAAARYEMSDIAQTMKRIGAAAGIPGGPFAIGTLAANVVSLMYHLVEMCGVMAELYGLDTQKDSVKAFVLAGASSDLKLMDQALAVIQANSPTAAPVTKKLVVSILLALQFNLGLRGTVSLSKVIPGLSAIAVAWTNFRTVKNTGRAFLSKLS